VKAFAKRAGTALLNWALFLTLPVWGGLLLFGALIYGATCGKTSDAMKIREMFTGARCLFDV
jgi:hypothetical protein